MFFTQFLESANKNYRNGMSKIVSIIKNILCLIEREICVDMFKTCCQYFEKLTRLITCDKLHSI